MGTQKVKNCCRLSVPLSAAGAVAGDGAPLPGCPATPMAAATQIRAAATNLQCACMLERHGALRCALIVAGRRCCPRRRRRRRSEPARSGAGPARQQRYSRPSNASGEGSPDAPCGARSWTAPLHGGNQSSFQAALTRE